MRTHRKLLLVSVLAFAIFGRASVAQQKSAATINELSAYDARRESTLIGTVLSYSASSPIPPLGPRVILQTPNGNFDVHLGDANFLAANHFTIQPGDTLRVIGEPLAYGKGTQFVARILQKGTQALTVRSVRGFPLSYVAPRHGSNPKSSGPVL